MQTFHIGRSIKLMNTSPWIFLAAALFAVAAVAPTASAQIGVGVSVTLAPPALPVYTQPLCPADGYLWTPGYWGYADDGGYYWVEVSGSPSAVTCPRP
jgi:hypothetical protein